MKQSAPKSELLQEAPGEQILPAEKPNILWIGCGGTIAMPDQVHGKPLEPSDGKYHVAKLRVAVPQVDRIANIQIEDFGNWDSVNMVPSCWTRLAELIDSNKGFDGFVINHGTDTMAYTAGALALAFGRGLSKPIVLTGSQVPVWTVGSDGVVNLENAFRVVAAAHRERVAEVMIALGDEVYRGCRARKRSEWKKNAFHSPAFPALALIAQPDIEFSEYAIKRGTGKRCRSKFTAGVLHVRLTPGIDPEFLYARCDSTQAAGVILESYGAGNVPEDLLSTIRRLTNQSNIPVVLTTSFVGGRTRLDYKSATDAIDAGGIPAYDMTPEMAAVKLMWVKGQDVSAKVSDVAKQMCQDVIGEISPELVHERFAS